MRMQYLAKRLGFCRKERGHVKFGIKLHTMRYNHLEVRLIGSKLQHPYSRYHSLIHEHGNLCIM